MPMVPDIETVIGRVETALKTVRKEAGRIHIRERNVVTEADLTEHFIDDGGIVRVTLVIDPDDTETEDEARQTYYMGHRIQLFHYLAFNDEEKSKTGFRKELAAIQNAFRHSQAVFGIPERPDHRRNITITTKNFVMLGDQFVHEGIMELTIEAQDLETTIF